MKTNQQRYREAHERAKRRFRAWDKVFHERIAQKLDSCPELERDWVELHSLAKSLEEPKVVELSEIPLVLKQDYMRFCELNTLKNPNFILSASDFMYWIETLTRNNRIYSFYQATKNEKPI